MAKRIEYYHWSVLVREFIVIIPSLFCSGIGGHLALSGSNYWGWFLISAILLFWWRD